MKTLSIILTLLISVSSQGQNDCDTLFLEEDITFSQKYQSVYVNTKGDTILQLDTAKYTMCFNRTLECFAIVALKGKPGQCWAIDRQENILFEVYSYDNGPDEITNGLIRIVDNKGKLGFANSKGQIIIKPQFEQASSFNNGFAIIGKKCKKVFWNKKHKNEDDYHFNIECKQTGYIDQSGKVLFIGNVSFGDVIKLLGWDKEQ